ncbi:MAG TPA: circadian clock KaiB family protein [Longimicrobium sp.]|jgi:hypothetical protein|uniref:circadian clock KaiB family protein n=1 Tax=Longimicrobium sp. TaxID=2029185 RepID=UPI002ED9351C
MHPHAPASPPDARPEVHLRLFVAGNAPNSLAALRSLRTLQEELEAGPVRVCVEVVDVAVDPAPALRDGVVVTPTLLRAEAPGVRVLGNLSDAAAVRNALKL